MPAPWPTVLVLCLALGACATVPEAPATATEQALLHGRALVQRHCAGCHNPNAQGPSAYRPAPPFRELVARHSPESLKAAVLAAPVTPHYGMPAMILTRTEAADIAAYVETLDPARGPRSRRLDIAPCLGLTFC